jgi:myo-inositol 2-dehydrogenase / D-chiro-inositol 1-dehydrogenase
MLELNCPICHHGDTPMKPKPTQSRREFLNHSGKLVAGAALAGALPVAGHTAESNTIQVALVGCGGRGTGAAANALATAGPVKLVAMADAFAHRIESSLENLSRTFTARVDVPPERRFTGLDGFKQAIQLLGKTDVVLLATPPAFRPIHFEHAVRTGVNVFMEKSFAVDAPGVRRLSQAGKVAREKNLKVAGGLMWRHDPARQQCIERIHDGAIGDLTMLRTYRMHGAVGYRPKQPDETELAYQLANYNNFTWLNGSFFVDWLIHNLDICCWAKDALPVSAQGMGGRCARLEPDQLFDLYMVEYAFADGTRLFAQGRHVNKCYDIFSDFAHGTNGSAVLMENLARANSRLYKNHVMTRENEIWRYSGSPGDPYQLEMDRLFEAIRKDKPYNETELCAKATLLAILGRMACESGQLVTWDEALGSSLELAPGLDNLTWNSSPPVEPDAGGRYPMAVPGQTEAL